MHIGQVAYLVKDGPGDFLTPVSHVDYHCPAAGVKITFTVGGFNPHALSTDRYRQGLVQASRKHRSRYSEH
jgi:hypothetical protein